MLVTSGVGTTEKEFVSSPAQFQLEPPGGNPFEVAPATAVTTWNGSFDVTWVENSFGGDIASAEEILDGMIARCKEDVERYPESAQVHANYGLALLNRRRLNEAVDAFCSALKLAPRHFVSLSNLARIRTLQGRFDEAEELSEELVSAYPGEKSAVVSLAYIVLRKNELERATVILKKAVAMDGEAIFARYLMAITLLKLGKAQEAIGHLRVAARVEVRSPTIHQALGVAYLIARDPRAAVRSFKTALTLAPDMKEAAHALGNVLLEQGNTEALIELMIGYLEKRPGDITGLELLAEAYEEQKQYPRARQQLTAALRLIHGDSENERKLKAKLLNNIGFCFDRQGDSEMAKEWIARSIAVDPEFHTTPYHNLARLYVRNHQLGQAWRIIEACKAKFPGNHETPEVEALVLAEERQYDKAIEVMRNEIGTGKANAAVYGILGWLLTDIKSDFAQAQNVLLEGLRRYPGSPILVNNMAYCLLMSGYVVEARQVLSSLPKGGKPLQLEAEVFLTATWGLLYLSEGDFVTGKKYYEMAETLAHGSRQKNLAAMVRQKMHLELAKAFLREGEVGTSKVEIARGLAIKNGRDVYEEALSALEERLGGTHHLDQGNKK